MKFSWRYVAYSAGAVVVILIGVLLTRSVDPLTRTVVQEATPKILKKAEGRADLTGIRKDNASPQDVSVYVDRSLSMRPYLSSPQESALYQLVQRLGDLVETNTELYGFGYETKNSERQSVESVPAVQLKDPSTYSFANNDYASLLRHFSDEKGTHLIVTDGVQSDPESEAGLREVLGAIDRWVRSGGTFATLLYRTSYEGQYYSDQPGTDPQYSCRDRPLTVFVLGRSSSVVNNLLQRFGDQLQPNHVIRLGENPLPIVPKKRGLATKNRRGPTVLRSKKKYFLDQYEQIYRATVVAGAKGKNGFLPFQFEATVDRSTFPWQALDKKETENFLRGLEPQIKAWALSRSKMESINESQKQARASFAPLPIAPQEDSSDALIHPADIQTRESRLVAVNVGEDSATVRIEVPMRRPNTDLKTLYFAALIRFGVGPRAARMLVPENYSTTNDLDPANCNKIYKLRRLIGSIMSRSYAPGQALIFTEWM